MDQLPPASIVPRPRRGVVLLASALALATAFGGGCGHHKRQSLRPVYTTPSAGCTNCGTSGAGAVVAPGPGATTVAPSSVTPSEVPSTVESSSTINSYSPPGATLSPPRPESAPTAEPTFNDLAPVGPNSSAVPSVPNLRNSNTSPSPSAATGRRSPPGRLRQAGLARGLAPYVNDPGDLFQPPKAERPWKYVVLHHSARPSGGYDQLDREHRKEKGWDGCGYHFVIGNGTGSPDGQVEVARRWVEQKHGIHCRDGKTADVSEYGIGICLVGDLDEAPPTPRQVEAAKSLVAYLGARYAIPADRIGTHAQLAAAPTACPGKHFPAQAILGSRSLALMVDGK